MIIKSTVFLILVIFLSFSDSKPSYRKCGNFVGVMADKNDCSKYYICSSGSTIPVPKTCETDYYFHPEFLLCWPKEEFTAEELKKCRKNADEGDDGLALPSSQGKVEWRNDTDENSKMKRNSLPSQIKLTIPIGQKKVFLNMKIQPGVVQNLKIVTNDKGRPEKWDAPTDEEWDVYSDVAKKASMSVALKKNKKNREILYEGSFEFENQTYSIKPIANRFMNPIKRESANKVVINGTSFLLIKEDIKNPVYETNLRRQERLAGNDSTISLMTDLERLVSQQFQALSNKRNFGIELLIVIDYSIFYKWYIRSTQKDEISKRRDAITNIRYYYTHIVNGINDRYISIKEPDMEFYVKLVGYFIAQSPTDSLFTENAKTNSKTTDAYRSLDEFEAWVDKQRNSPINPLPNFDSVALFTNYDLLSPRSNNFITGLANIGATCTLKGASINKDQLQYATIGTAAHEIGHNMGALHDDPLYNSCRGADQYIMASAPGGFNSQNFFNAYKFSTCSIDHFRKYIADLDKNRNNCLLNAAVDPDPGSTSYFLQTFPGQKFTIDEQCQLLYGSASFYCAGGGESDQRLCRELICFDPFQQKCTSKPEIRALDGTLCGNQKWCYRSTCQYNAKALTKPENNCIYGDFKAIFSHNGRTARCEDHVRVNKASCYSEFFKDKCCESCAKAYNNLIPNCEYGDKNSVCSSKNIIDCYDASIKERCCEYCSKNEKKNLAPGCEYGDRASWCTSINPASCYQSDSTCCEFCAQNVKNIPNCKYGDKTPGCTTAHCSSPSHREGCCYTCRNQNPVQTTTTTTPPPKYPNECPNGNTAYWCNTIQKGDCYARKSECCETCMDFADPSNPGCEYGDKWSNCRDYVRGAVDCLRSDIRQNCCEACKPYITPNSDPPECDEGNQVHFCQRIQPWECYTYKKTCCRTCRQYFNPRITDCEYGDKVSWCSSYITSYNHCKRKEVAELCCKYCDNIKKTFDENDGLEDKAPWCKSMFAGYCYQPQVEETCGLSCNKHRKNRTGECRYGDFYDWCDPQYCSTNRRECCESCA